MTATYPFEMQLVVDPDNPRNIVAAGVVSIYDSEDLAKTTLLALTDPNGVPIPNPITSNANGFTPPFVTTSPQVLWVSGPYVDYFSSYKGLRDEAVAAVAAAEAAAATAGTEAAAVATSAIGTATDDATAAAASAATAASNAAASATSATNAAALVGAPADTAMAAAANNTGSQFRAALSATILDKIKTDSVPKWKAATAYLAGDKVVAPSGDVVSAKVDFTSGASYSAANWNYSTTFLGAAGTKTDTSAGILDWQNNSTSGYIVHARTGPLSTSAVAAMAIGTDLGAGNGLLISHKNTGIGVLATGQPGSGRIAEFTSRGSGSGFWINVQAGGASAQVNARDGGGFPDGSSTGGSTTFTSATAAFTAGDVGKAIVQLTSRGDTDPFGSIQAGTTIASVTNATTVVLSQPSAATGSNIMFNVAGRLPALTQPLFRIMETDLVTELVKFTRGGANFKAADVASIPLTAEGKAGQTARIFAAVKNGDATPVFAVNSDGSNTSTSGMFANNAGVPGADPFTATTYSSHASIIGVRAGAGSGDNFQARGNGATPLSRFNKDGVFITKINAAPADADLAVGEGAVWIDPTPGTGGVRWKIKATDGSIINKTL
ncbi:hypothetical protein [Arthrobacter sp. NPDC056493]|uniref:hypothetical protein n=1 Tax=Arthrobacter sp. NPDC056493 TaxID=3345839 RepID=UPI003671B894